MNPISKKRKPIIIDLTVDNSNMDPLYLFREKKPKVKEEDQITELPEEIILMIMSHLPLSGILNFSCISRKYNRISKREHFWEHMFCKYNFDVESPLTRSLLKETGSWKSTFKKRYCQNQCEWDVVEEWNYPSEVFWASLSNINSNFFVLTSSTLDVVTYDQKLIQSIYYNNCSSQYSSYIKALEISESRSFQLSPTNILKIFHNKQNDTIIMYHVNRGILIFIWDETELKLIHNIEFQLSSIIPVVHMEINFTNNVIICSMCTSLYIFDFKQACRESSITPILTYVLKEDIKCLSINDDYAFWTDEKFNISLYKISAKEFLDTSRIEKKIYGNNPLLLIRNNQLYIVSHSWIPKVNVINFTLNTHLVIDCYRNHGYKVYRYGNTRDVNFFLTANEEGIIKFWELNSGRCTDVFSLSHMSKSEVLTLFCQEDVLIASERDKISVWNLISKKQIFVGNTKSITKVDYFKDKMITISEKKLSLHSIKPLSHSENS